VSSGARTAYLKGIGRVRVSENPAPKGYVWVYGKRDNIPRLVPRARLVFTKEVKGTMP